MNERAGLKLEETPNLADRLSGEEKAFRKGLLDRLLAAGHPLAIAELVEGATGETTSVAEIERLVAALQAKGLLVRDKNGAIVSLYPVSARPTNHRVRLADGRDFFAMCAIDALGCAFEFEQEATISSSCSHCRGKLSITLGPGGIVGPDPAEINVLHADLDHYADWAANC